MVYLIHNTVHDICKIGYSDKPAARMANLQTATPYKLRMAGLLPGGRAEEQRMHRLFADQRINGEWFIASDELFACFEPMANDCFDASAMTLLRDALPMLGRLSATARHAFDYVMQAMPLNQPMVQLIVAQGMAAMRVATPKSFYDGINELVYYNFLARDEQPNRFYTNSGWYFRGVQLKPKQPFPTLADSFALPLFACK